MGICKVGAWLPETWMAIEDMALDALETLVANQLLPNRGNLDGEDRLDLIALDCFCVCKMTRQVDECVSEIRHSHGHERSNPLALEQYVPERFLVQLVAHPSQVRWQPALVSKIGFRDKEPVKFTADTPAPISRMTGKTIEPVIEPMGFDWKIGIGLITSFAARETFVSTMSTIYGISDDDNESLKTNISKDYTPLIAISVMVFYVYAAQCMSTFAIVKRETNSWKWPAFMIIYMTMLAYIGSTLVYQIGLASGYS